MERLLYYIIGPVTDSDITIIEKYDKEDTYSNIVVILQGGIDPDIRQEYSTTLMGAFPANAGMNPGTKFHKTPNPTERGWYDLLNTEKLTSLKKVSVICQTTNSAKPKPGIMDDPRSVLWKKLHENPVFDNLNLIPIKNLIKIYDNFTNAPWQHDPIAVIHSILLLMPQFFEEHKNELNTMFEPKTAQYIDFSSSTDGIIVEDSDNPVSIKEMTIDVEQFLNKTKGKGQSYVIPYKENTQEMNHRGIIRKAHLITLLEKLVDKPNTNKPKPDASGFTKIICSLEIYDPDNLLALKCVEALSIALSIELEIVVHYQKYPANIKFIKEVNSVNNYNDESTFDKNHINDSIKNITNYNGITIENTSIDLINKNFKGNIFLFSQNLDKTPNLLNRYISGLLMYSQTRNEFKIEKDIMTFEKEEENFIKFLLNPDSKIKVSPGSIYGGMTGYTISIANVLHPVSMFTRADLNNPYLDIPAIITKCINTSILNTDRLENIKSWNDETTLTVDNSDMFDSNHVRRVGPNNIFHWNILDPGTCSKNTVGHYYKNIQDTPYYTETNNKRMKLIAEILVDELKKGSVIQLQEYSHLQHDILKQQILDDVDCVDLENETPITQDNINDYLHYVYGMPILTPGIIIDSGLLICCFYKFDKKNTLIIPGFRPIIHVQIGDNIYSTTHYDANEGTEIQSKNNKIINEQLSKLIKLTKNIFFSCDMNKAVDANVPNDTQHLQYYKGEHTNISDRVIADYPFIFENNDNTERIGYNKSIADKTPPYVINQFKYIQQEIPNLYTAVAILFTFYRYLIDVVIDGISYKKNSDIDPNELYKYTHTAPAKKIDGIFTTNSTFSNKVKVLSNKVKVLSNKNDSQFLSDHRPLKLNMSGSSKASMLEELNESNVDYTIPSPISIIGSKSTNNLFTLIQGRKNNNIGKTRNNGLTFKERKAAAKLSKKAAASVNANAFASANASAPTSRFARLGNGFSKHLTNARAGVSRRLSNARAGVSKRLSNARAGVSNRFRNMSRRVGNVTRRFYRRRNRGNH